MNHQVGWQTPVLPIAGSLRPSVTGPRERAPEGTVDPGVLIPYSANPKLVETSSHLQPTLPVDQPLRSIHAVLLAMWTLIPPLPALAQEAGPRTRDTLELTEVRVVGSRALREAIAGAATVVDSASIAGWRPLTVNELARRVPGVQARDEEGLGLRPNIGIRGLDPTRSRKVLLLEDGIPLALAPYGDNSSYYHPPVTRFTRVEVLKGSGQILFGPQTIGGVINYVTPAIPKAMAASFTLAGGTQRHALGQVNLGGTWGRVGLDLNASRRRADGGRENTGTLLDDVTVKSTVAVAPGHSLTVRGNAYNERSNVTYSGLTEAEWAIDPRANPFRHDSMFMRRWGASVTDRLDLGQGVTLLTTAYASGVSRDWWRLSSNSSERPNDRKDPACGGMENLATSCGNQGRLRDYAVWGLEPRLRAPWTPFGSQALLEFGVRVHDERQARLQLNGDSPNARGAGPASDRGSGTVEDNVRTTRAYSAFAQSRWFLGCCTVTPGLRLEHVRHERVNRLASTVVTGGGSLTQIVPGLGVTWAAAQGVTVYGGAHRGFAPPRVEDLIDNATGTVVELDAELSWNWELGVRTTAVHGLDLEATLFRLDFENQIVSASVAGGAGATLTSAGRTLHQGLELAARIDAASLLGMRQGLLLDAAWTWVPTAEYRDERFAFIGASAAEVIGKVYGAQNAAGTRRAVSVAGNRLPYAPVTSLTVGIGYRHGSALDARLEAVHVGRQFGDALNSTVTVVDGQQGVLPAHTIWNATVNHAVTATGGTVFVAAKNLFDRLYVSDRTRGMLPGAPRSVQVGITQPF